MVFRFIVPRWPRLAGAELKRAWDVVRYSASYTASTLLLGRYVASMRACRYVPPVSLRVPRGNPLRTIILSNSASVVTLQVIITQCRNALLIDQRLQEGLGIGLDEERNGCPSARLATDEHLPKRDCASSRLRGMTTL